MENFTEALFATRELINGEWYVPVTDGFFKGVVFALGCCMELGLGIGFAIAIPTFVKALCKRFIWPGKKKDPPADKQ